MTSRRSAVMRKISLAAIMAALSLAAPGAGRSDDCFLALAGIHGSAPSGPFGRDTIELLGWGWGGAADSSTAAGTGAGRSPVAEIRFSKRFGAPSSVDLQKARHTGTLMAGGRLICFQVYGRGDAYLKLEFNDVRVVDLQTRHVPGQIPPSPVESVAVGFSRILMDAAPVGQDGSTGPPLLFGWNYAAGSSINRGSPMEWGRSGSQGTGGPAGVPVPVQTPAKVLPSPTSPQSIRK